MKKKILTLSLAAVLLAALTFGGTVAYFKAEDSAENTMTLGSVKIDQLEYEREVGDDGSFALTNDGTYRLREFTQDKPLFPVYFANGSAEWDNTLQSFAQVGAEGSIKVFGDSVKGAVDKMILVENTGKSDAYVRTLVAFEYGTYTQDADKAFLGIDYGGTDWQIGADVYAEIDGNTYEVVEFIYKANDGVLLSEEITNTPSLAQVYMMPFVTNEDIEAIDGNRNGKYDILVLSQACQVAGLESLGAAEALNTAFDEVTAANAKTWFEAAF